MQAHDHVSGVCDTEHVTQVWVYGRFMLPVGGQVICDLAQSLVVQSLHINAFWLVWDSILSLYWHDAYNSVSMTILIQ